MVSVTISDETWLESANIADGTFAPLSGFQNQRTYNSVVQEMCLPSGEPWTIPITLPVPASQRSALETATDVTLQNSCGEDVAVLHCEELFEVQTGADAKRIFGTEDSRHPGVARELALSSLRLSGQVTLLKPVPHPFPSYALTPDETKKIFVEKGWKTITGFQTRNPAHRAHEYLQRVAMEITDGIFLQPLIGWKKPDDFSPDAVMAAYKILVNDFYPEEHALLGTLTTPMRYAGPREAVFHAIIRKNHGCTHFIIGRDHAGVGDFYPKYAAQKLALRMESALGITILPLKGPFYCSKSGMIVTENTSRYRGDGIEAVSGTRMRKMLAEGKRPPQNFMRPEIADALIALAKENRLFVGDANGL